MRIAYCIQCHKNNEILREFIRVLSLENDIYVNVDKKSNQIEFKEYENKVTFIENRVEVTWADSSQIQSTINTLKCINLKKYDYVFLVSGECLPVKSDRDIKEFLKINNGKEFIGIEKEYDNSLLKKRVKYKYSRIHYKKNKNKLEKLYVLGKEKFKLNKKNKYFKELPKLYKGCNWFGLTTEACMYILDYLQKNKNYLNAFENSIYGDEVFFHTIIMNSKYRNNIYNYNLETDDNKMALRYIDWKTGPEYPRILDETDFEKIKQSECILARKFNSNIDIDQYRNFFNIDEK